MTLTASQLATTVEAELRGDGAHVLTACTGLDDAAANHVSFLANRKYAGSLATTKAGAVILSKDDAAQAPAGLTVLIAKDPYFAFRQAVVALHGFRQQPVPGISPLAVIGAGATIGPGASIQPFVVIEAGATIGARTVIHPHCYIGKAAVIGEDCILYPNVTLYEHCVLGNRVTLHAGCVIGQDGFGYATHKRPGEPVMHHKIPQIGNAVVEDDVEMGAGCAIDRATVGSTRIGAGTKFSDHIAIGHGASLGRYNLLVAQVGIAGSTDTGDYVVMGGQVGVAGHLEIGTGAQLAAQSGVMTDIPAGEKWGGQPAMPLNQAKRIVLALTRVPDLLKEVKDLQKRVEELEGK
jgi:UDP-3-O-[3-hydroxymyristoyl] glucosamine N-acyltransferase